MGFGFNLFFVFVLVPSTIVLLIFWLVTKKTVIGRILGFIWLGIIGLVILSFILQALTSKTVLKKKDYYGQYIVDRNFFKGKQADWQYNTFRFEIRENDSIYFYVTDKENIVQTYKGSISTVNPYGSERLTITMSQPTHHVLYSDPTIYRGVWSFTLVFNSPKFGNMFFKQGQWKAIDN